ncbi:MAG: SGNH/GDSL hydrolase family protein [Elusimicrobiales bacterium]
MKKLILCALLLLGALPAGAGTVLFVGDSHSVGPFGWKLDALLREAGHRAATYASCGSIAQWWVTGKPTPCGYFFRDLAGGTQKGQKGPTPIFADLLAQIKPEVVIVELGANYSGNPSDEFAVKDMRAMADAILAAGASCLWVTKPDSRKNHEDIPRILELTYKATEGKCPVFDSTLVTKYPAAGGDGIHYWFKEGLPIADAWAARVYEWAAPRLPAKPAPPPAR